MTSVCEITELRHQMNQAVTSYDGSGTMKIEYGEYLHDGRGYFPYPKPYRFSLVSTNWQILRRVS